VEAANVPGVGQEGPAAPVAARTATLTLTTLTSPITRVCSRKLANGVAVAATPVTAARLDREGREAKVVMRRGAGSMFKEPP
jgi:hypothetical protein